MHDRKATAAIIVTFCSLLLPVAASAQPQWSTLLPGLPGQLTRFYHSAVFDPVTDRMIVFGGQEDSATFNDVLALTHANGLGGAPQWVTLVRNRAAGAPSLRSGHSAVYDSATNRMIVFAGATGSSAFFNDVWVLSNANGSGGIPTWNQLAPTGGPPTGRFAHSAVYDPASNRMITFGGTPGGIGTAADVWVLSNANGFGGTPAWTQLAPIGGPPEGQSDFSAVYDSLNNVMTVFGGRLNGVFTVTNSVWTLSNANGLGGTPVWTRRIANGTPGSPSRRAGHRATYDPGSNRMTIFGGTADNYPVISSFNDVWVLSNANGLGGPLTWAKLSPTVASPAHVLPAQRLEHSAVFDPVNNRMIIFAGTAYEATYSGVWVLSGANGL